jgi:heme-degrading monooxygenase HmoA
MRIKGTRMTRIKPRFTIVWEFLVRPGKRREFEKTYGPRGSWARLFRRGRGYLRTELMRDGQRVNRYLVLDVWTSRAAYEKFKAANRVGYQALDQRCESMTEMEVEIGRWEAVKDGPGKS